MKWTKKGNETLHVTEYYNSLDDVIDVSSILPNGLLCI